MLDINIKTNHFLITSAATRYGAQSINGATRDTDGNTTKDTIVKLFDQESNLFINSTLVNKDGEYAFKNVDLEKFTFFVIAHHPTGEYNGVIADNIHGVQDVES